MTRSDCLNRNGFGSLEDLTQDMERVIETLFGRPPGSARSGSSAKYHPALDVSESDNGYVVSVDLPGVKPEDVKVEMHEGKLIIAGSRQRAAEENNQHRVERPSGEFSRVVALPHEIDLDSIDAAFELGVLHVTLPKIAKQQPKKIQIRTSDK